MDFFFSHKTLLLVFLSLFIIFSFTLYNLNIPFHKNYGIINLIYFNGIHFKYIINSTHHNIFREEMNDYDYHYNQYDLEGKSRSKFVSKVYSILSIQLCITAFFVCVNVWSPTFAYIQDSYFSLRILAVVTCIGCLLALGISLFIKHFPEI